MSLLNPFTYVGAEVNGLCVFSNHPSTFGTRVTWGIKYGSLSPRSPIRRRVALGCISRWLIF